MGRDLTKCHPRLQKLAKELMAACEKQGCPIGIGECFRTVQEQNRLYAQEGEPAGSVNQCTPEAPIAPCTSGEWRSMYTGRTEKEPITNQETIFREWELSENRWVWNGAETGNPLWINHIFNCRTGEVPRTSAETVWKYLRLSGNLDGIGYIHRKTGIFRRRDSAYRGENTDGRQHAERMDPGVAKRTDPTGLSAGYRRRNCR